MPGPLLTFATQVQCVHMGLATATTPSAHVSVLGVPAVAISSPFTVAGCTFPAMTMGASPPCVTAQFITAATRITSSGQPLLLVDSQATCTPNGTPVIIAPSQTKVTAQ